MKMVFATKFLTIFLFAAPALAQEPIRIGVTQPLTGAFAASGLSLIHI